MYRGLFASISNMAALTAIQFFGVGLIKQAIVGNEDRALSGSEILISAFAGGALSGIVCGPLELTMIQQQRFGLNIINTPTNIIRETGIFGMCRGILPSITREGIFTCGYLGVTPLLNKEISKNDKFNSIPKPILQFGCSMSAGLIASGLSHPADTIKTVMQGDIQQTTYKRAISSLTYIVNRDGIQGLYRGFIWRYLRMGMTFFIFNLTMEPVSHLLFPHAFNLNNNNNNDNEEQTLYQSQ